VNVITRRNPMDTKDLTIREIIIEEARKNCTNGRPITKLVRAMIDWRPSLPVKRSSNVNTEYKIG
jgi:hypothetical protein